MPDAKLPKMFTREDYDKLRAALRDLHDAQLVIDKAEGCGIECEGFKQIKSELQDFLLAIEREFMTPPPTDRSI